MILISDLDMLPYVQLKMEGMNAIQISLWFFLLQEKSFLAKDL